MATRRSTGNPANNPDAPAATVDVDAAEPVAAELGVSGEEIEGVTRKTVTAPKENESLTKKFYEGTMPEGTSVRFVERGGESRPVFTRVKK